MDSPPVMRLAGAGDDNFVTHASLVARSVGGMHVAEQPDLTLVDSGLACDTFNFVCRARLTPESADRRIAEAVSYFGAVGRPFSWWVGPADQPRDLGDRLVEAGLERAETELAMAAELDLLPEKMPAPDQLGIRRVATTADLERFALILAANGTPPDPDVLSFYEQATSIVLDSDCAQRLYLGFLGDEPVATAEITVGGGVAGVYNISTREPFRRRGIGTAVTLQPLLEARSEGLRIGVLQAAAEGVGIYARLGFRAFGDITEYKPPVSASA